jgi:hypothetical protein
MTKHVHCGSFFAGNEDTEHKNWTLVIGDDGVIAYAGPTTAAPLPGPNATVVDYSGLFVMPGMLDVHTHLAYGNAKTEEDIDLYQPLEFRAIRGLFFAQKVVAAGYTSITTDADGNPRTVFDDAEGATLTDWRSPRPLPHHAAGPDRPVSDLDRGAGDLHRAPGFGTRRGDRGDSPPGEDGVGASRLRSGTIAGQTVNW